ncbi:MAG: VOC family protein [Bacteroidota bacterium]
MMKIDPIIAVQDVEASSKWYQSLLGCKSAHGGKEFDMLVDESGEVLFCLHKWGIDEHPAMVDSSITPGNGLILYFRTEALDQKRKNAEILGAKIEAELHLNPNSHNREFSLRDPDGYYITLTEYHNYGG